MEKMGRKRKKKLHFFGCLKLEDFRGGVFLILTMAGKDRMFPRPRLRVTGFDGHPSSDPLLVW